MRSIVGIVIVAWLCVTAAVAQDRRVLYVTHSAGYRHDSIPDSIQALQSIAGIEVVATEDVSLLNAATLRGFDAVFFYTSGELPITEQQKADLLAFIRAGKGFGGVHSATDTFYQWPEYGELIGARFAGHPWVQSVRLDVEDPAHPAMASLASGFSFYDEIYQFRGLSRDQVRVLFTLDPHSVDLAAPGVQPNTEDFPLAWCRRYGEGRVFYTALGHFPSAWRDPRFQTMLAEALRWMTGLVEADATPRPPRRPNFAARALGNAAHYEPWGTVSPGSLISIFGADLTPGSAAAAETAEPVFKLAGSTVKINGQFAPLLYASPAQINAYVPLGVTGEVATVTVGGAHVSNETVVLAAATPGIFAVTSGPDWATLWATGLGAVQSREAWQITPQMPIVKINGETTTIIFSGLAPGSLGLYQINVLLLQPIRFPAKIQIQLGQVVVEQELHY